MKLKKKKSNVSAVIYADTQVQVSLFKATFNSELNS